MGVVNIEDNILKIIDKIAKMEGTNKDKVLTDVLNRGLEKKLNKELIGGKIERLSNGK
ncbi:hypothetical protein [Methanobrevibacter filiformis]|nr:hypothetical protein [Methanobrevibacter filiformis]